MIKPYAYVVLLAVSPLFVKPGSKLMTGESVHQKTLPDSIGIKYHFDTTQYTPHKSGFYISKNSDVFQLNRLTYPDSNDVWVTHYWLDSLMFYGKYPNKKPLREIIDLATFTTDSLGSFEKDKNHVYFVWPTSDGVRRYIVKGADVRSFQGIMNRWGKDHLHVFYENQKVKKADPVSFRVLNDLDSARDKKYIYYEGERIR